MRIASPFAPLPVARWSSHLLRVGTGLTATMVAAAAPGLTVASAAAPHAREVAPIPAAVTAHSTIHLRGSLWIDCRRDGRRSVQDPPVRGAIIELVTSSGQLSTTVTGRAGGYAFTLRRGRPYAVAVPLIQTPLDGLAPSPLSRSHAGPGRSIGTRVADLDRVEVTAAGTDGTILRVDFGFIAATPSGRALFRAECPHPSRPLSWSSRA